MELRKLSKNEERLIEFLIERARTPFLPNGWQKNLLAQSMNDGGMGSLSLFPTGKYISNRQFGERISDVEFFDGDGIKVIASLNLDQDGELYELDIWKTDFSPLINLPEFFQV